MLKGCRERAGCSRYQERSVTQTVSRGNLTLEASAAFLRLKYEICLRTGRSPTQSIAGPLTTTMPLSRMRAQRFWLRVWWTRIQVMARMVWRSRITAMVNRTNNSSKSGGSLAGVDRGEESGLPARRMAGMLAAWPCMARM